MYAGVGHPLKAVGETPLSNISTRQTLVLDCLGARKVIGGGAEIVGEGPVAPREVALVMLKPTDDDRNWIASAVEVVDTNAKWAIRGWATCVPVGGFDPDP